MLQLRMEDNGIMTGHGCLAATEMGAWLQWHMRAGIEQISGVGFGSGHGFGSGY